MSEAEWNTLPDSEYLCAFCEGKMKVLKTLSATSEESVCVECLEIVLISTAYGFPTTTRLALGGVYLEEFDEIQTHETH